MHDRVKVFFPLDPPSADGTTGEWLWATPKGGDKYQIDNIPFDVYDISCGDVVAASEVDDALTFRSVVTRSGNSTYRIKLPKHHSHDDFLETWPPFEAHNCSYEGGSGIRRLYSIHLQKDTDVYAVYRLLEEGEKSGKFEFEEAHCFNPK